MAEKDYSEQDGFNILVREGDEITSDQGPSFHAPGNVAMWVPKGTLVNGKLVKKDGSQDED